MNVAKFWGNFDLQHATFSGQTGKVDVNYAKSRNFNTALAAPPSGLATRVAAPSAGQVAAQSAAVVYNVSLAANRGAIITKLSFDIANKLGLTIEMAAPPIGSGGVLCGYTVTRSKNPDAMGQYIFSYNHDVAVIGSGRNALDVYRIALSGPATISAPTKEYRPVANPLAIRDLGFAWVYRQAK